MKALGFNQHGDINQMQFFDIPTPAPQKNEILVQVKASAFNHLDIWVREGWPGLELSLPHVSGSDASGLVCEVGPEVTEFKKGDRIAINPGITPLEDEFTIQGEQSESPSFKIIGEDLAGTHAEYMTIPARNCIKLPENIAFETAAAAGLVSMTAWRMLFKRANVRLGETVLIIGAGGGVNSIAIQLAKLAGCCVYAVTSSPAKILQAKNLGVNHIYNYKENPDWHKQLLSDTQKRGVDLVVDNVGSKTFSQSMQVVRRGGRIVIVGNTSGPFANIDIRYIFSKQISLIGSTMGNQQDYYESMQLVFKRKIQPIIYKMFPFHQGIEAMRILEKGEQFGKIVLSHS